MERKAKRKKTIKMSSNCGQIIHINQLLMLTIETLSTFNRWTRDKSPFFRFFPFPFSFQMLEQKREKTKNKTNENIKFSHSEPIIDLQVNHYLFKSLES